MLRNYPYPGLKFVALTLVSILSLSSNPLFLFSSFPVFFIHLAAYPLVAFVLVRALLLNFLPRTFPLITLLCSCLLARFFSPSSGPHPDALLFQMCFLMGVWRVEFSWSPRGVLATDFKHRARGIRKLVEFNPGIGI